jgi:hypothetical protein
MHGGPLRIVSTAALIVSLGVASVSAEQRPVKLTLSGSMVATTIELQPNTITDEEQMAGNGTFGRFTFRKLRADETPPLGTGSCGSGLGPIIRVVSGGGVFRFEDGSLLTATVTEGTLCVDLDHSVGHLVETYQKVVLFSSAGAPKLLTMTGNIEGQISGPRKGLD